MTGCQTLLCAAFNAFLTSAAASCLSLPDNSYKTYLIKQVKENMLDHTSFNNTDTFLDPRPIYEGGGAQTANKLYFFLTENYYENGCHSIGARSTSSINGPNPGAKKQEWRRRFRGSVNVLHVALTAARPSPTTIRAHHMRPNENETEQKSKKQSTHTRRTTRTSALKGT